MEDTSSRKAVIIGGSLGRLFAGAMLRHAGWEVAIYERSSHDLDSRGGGVVLQPDVVTLMNVVGAQLDQQLGVVSQDRVTYAPDGTERSRDYAPQTQTSWSLIYKTMRDHFGSEHYHKGKALTHVTQNHQQVTATFADGSVAHGDLLIAADGGHSTVRNIVAPHNTPHYAGYVAWRGLVAERDIPPVSQPLLEHFSFANNGQSHMLGYLVPGDNNSIAQGKRYYNWVWYLTAHETDELPDAMMDKNGKQREFSMPPGMLSQRWKDRIRAKADDLLPPVFREVVYATHDPFAQAILDLTSDRMVHGRIILLGDAAFIPRPHTAASTAKAAANASALGNALANAYTLDAINAALAEWEEPQLWLGQYLYRRGSQTGNHLMFSGTL